MRPEAHERAFEEHKRTLFTWALETEGIEKSQRTIGLHASRGILELLSVILHRKNLIDEGFQLNHRWFKSPKASERLPEFEHKKEIVARLVELENLCEILAYGAEQPVTKTQYALKQFTELETLLRQIL